MAWDGIERRHAQASGIEGRRSGDWHCPDHATIQDSTKEHRTIVCAKIRSVKEDSEKDLAALKSYHDADMGELKLAITAKAGHDELVGIMRFLKILMGVAIMVIAGQAVWLKSDIGSVKSDISDVGNKIQRLNQRVTEGVDDRVRMDIEQTKQLENISGEMRVVSWRLAQIEDAHKVAK